MSTRRRKIARAIHHRAVPWILARKRRVGFVVSGSSSLENGAVLSFRTHGIVAAPTRPRWARWMTPAEWRQVWEEAAGAADLFQRMEHVRKVTAASERPPIVLDIRAGEAS